MLTLATHGARDAITISAALALMSGQVLEMLGRISPTGRDFRALGKNP